MKAATSYCLSWSYCQICFVSSDKRNIKRRNFQKLTDLCRFEKVAEASEKVDYEYSKINQMVDWQDFAEKWAHKACKGKFFKKEFLASQMQFISTNQFPSEKDQQNNESVCETTKDVDTLRKSVRQPYKYPSRHRRKLNVHKTFRKRPVRLLNVLCTFNLCPVFTGMSHLGWTMMRNGV